ncbi:glutathione S-transferase N-terminal domain-containing protein [Aurantimonas sp. Leaf443]|uniref:glutathione S-transferase N-terminal domain-containing protein n=1 Tax=Aurantimonas sp. Leaf443 TaxID=1736378 RepID=UPI000701D8BE|nr:glutathione S-transferase N-terminal domain-containing protein [Aurantimonas sp. Leaf443]KQT88132.1 glutathione S-transferase [Aurantimonas sp. Leaf443]
MIDLYTWTTPNGEKPVLMLEELGLDYALHLVDISTGAQKKPDFLALNPNGRIPALVDRRSGADLRVFESGAILVHLAEQSGRFLPTAPAERAETFAWTFFQVGGTGPMIGQYHHFATYAKETIPYAIERYAAEGRRLLGVLDGRLSTRDHLAGAYSIADIINYSWAKAGVDELAEEGQFPALRAWLERVGSRPAIVAGLSKLSAAKAALSDKA